MLNLDSIFKKVPINHKHYIENMLTISLSHRLNIGGQDFEATARTLSRDPFSLLAAICQDDSPIKPQEETNQIFIDRDW